MGVRSTANADVGSVLKGPGFLELRPQTAIFGEHALDSCHAAEFQCNMRTAVGGGIHPYDLFTLLDGPSQVRARCR